MSVWMFNVRHPAFGTSYWLETGVGVTTVLSTAVGFIVRLFPGSVRSKRLSASAVLLPAAPTRLKMMAVSSPR